METDLTTMEYTNEQPVFQQNRPFIVEKESLVDFLKPIPLHHQYHRVKLDGHRLLIDIKIDQPVGSQKVKVYEDSFRLIQTVFTETTNVDEIYMRFVQKPKDETDFVLALFCERDEAIEQFLTQKYLTIEQPFNYRSFLEENAQLIYGEGWRK